MKRRRTWYLCAGLALILAGIIPFAACAENGNEPPAGEEPSDESSEEDPSDEPSGEDPSDEPSGELQRATIELGGLSWVYDGTAKTAQATLSPEAAGEVTIEYFYDGSAVNECVAAGEYTVRASLVSDTYEAEPVEETMVIAPKSVTIGGIEAVDKYADGDTEIAYTGTAAVQGVVPGDEVTAEDISLSVSDAAYGVGKDVSVTAQLGGADAENYTLSMESALTVNIYPVYEGLKLKPVIKDGAAAEYTITGYEGDAVTLILPSELDGVPVTAMADGAFAGSALTDVTVPEGLAFSAAAFDGCTTLASLILNENGFEFHPTFSENSIASVAAVGYGGAGGQVSIPAQIGGVPVTELGAYLFAGNATVTSLTIPAEVTSIGLALAQNASALKTVTFEARTQDIAWGEDQFGAWTFAGSAVESIVIGDGLVTIPRIFATGAASLQTVAFGNSVASIGAEAFKQCTVLNDVVLPALLTTIGNDAFRECRALSSTVIPAAVCEMGTAVFQDASALTSVVFEDRGHDITFALGDLSGSWMFFNCTALNTVVIGDGITALPAIFAPTSAVNVTLGKDVVSLGSESFPNAKTVVSLTIDSAVIAEGLVSADAYYGLFANATTIRLADGLEASEYVLQTYTQVTTEEGYTVYSKAE